MAILPDHPGIKISIACNGAAPQEYVDEDEEPSDTIVSRYIKATSGAEFGVLYQKFIHCTFLDPSHYKDGYRYLEKGAWTMSDGQQYLHRFTFAGLTVDDSIAAMEQKRLLKSIKDIGEITVRAHFVINLQYRIVTHRPLRSDLTAVGNVPEKALKGNSVSHQASLRAGQPLSRQFQVADYDFVDPSKRPFAIYKFKYRSRASLRSLLVIPRSPSPVPLEERDIETLSIEEMRELLRRQRESAAAAHAIKQERGIKRERTRRRTVNSDNEANAGHEDEELNFVSTKRCRTNYTTVIDDNGVEVCDLT